MSFKTEGFKQAEKIRFPKIVKLFRINNVFFKLLFEAFYCNLCVQDIKKYLFQQFF